MRVFLFFLVCVVILLVGYEVAYPDFSFHVRQTIVVEDHGREKSASSVIELGEASYPTFGGLFGSGSETYARGEATFLDLGNGNNLIALLGLGGGAQDDILTITRLAFFNTPKASDYGTLGYGKRIVSQNKSKPKDLQAPNLPTLVHFRDLSDRKTIEAVDPTNSEAALGPGIKLLRVTLEITDAPVTEGFIDGRLPWLKALIGNNPMDRLPIYNVQQPELAQDRIFFVGFRRD